MNKTICIVVTLIACVSLLIIGLIFYDKKDRNIPSEEETGYTAYTSDMTSEEDIIRTETTEEHSTEKQPENINSTFSADKIKLLNLFLSNFSELRYNNITNKNTSLMIDFVMLNTRFNDFDNYSGGYSLVCDGKEYTYSLGEEYVKERINRFFGTETSNISTDSTKYSDGRYYIQAADGEFLPYFSKATDVFRNLDGSLTVNFTIYSFNHLCNNTIDVDSGLYDGFGDENVFDSEVYGTGTAVLKEKYFGESYANYTLESLTSKVSGNTYWYSESVKSKNEILKHF